MADLKETVIVVLLIAIVWFGYSDQIKETFGVTTPEAPSGDEIAERCVGVDGVTVTLNAQDKYNVGTALTDSNYYKIINGGTSSTKSVSDAGTFEASVGDDLEVWFSLRTAAGGKHYATYEKFTLPCKSTYEATGDVYPRGNITTKLYSDDNGNILQAKGSTNPENETLASGDEVTLSGTITMESETARPYGGVVVLDYEKNNYSSSKFALYIGGTKLEKVSVPSQHSSASSAKNSLAFKYPAIYEASPVDFAITIASLSGINPGANGREPVSDDYLNLSWYDYDYFEGDDGTIVLSLEDPDNFADIGDENKDSYGILIN